MKKEEGINGAERVFKGRKSPTCRKVSDSRTLRLDEWERASEVSCVFKKGAFMYNAHNAGDGGIRRGDISERDRIWAAAPIPPHNLFFATDCWVKIGNH